MCCNVKSPVCWRVNVARPGFFDSAKMSCRTLLMSIFVSYMCCIVCLVSGEENGGTKTTHTVSTLLNAKWNSTPLALEVSEFLNEEDASFFWAFVDQVAGLSEEGKTDKAYYEELLKAAGRHLSESQVSLLRFSLSLHVYSPKVEMFQQMAKGRGVNCETAAEINGQLTCDAADVETLLKLPTKNPDVYQLDHQYPAKSTGDKPVVILYGQMGSGTFPEFHKKLKPLADDGGIIYLLRHYVHDNNRPKVRLSGYGVELQIKSTEYKAQDDTKVKADKVGSAGEESASPDEEEDVEGFLFNRLKLHHPDLAGKLEQFKQQLIDESQELAPLKVWQLQELSLQAAERILSSSRDEALRVLVHLSQNFPLLARSLVRTIVRPGLKDEIRRNQQRFTNQLNLQPSETALFINGHYFNMDVVDMFSIFDQIRQEVKLVEGLHKIGVPAKYVSPLLSLDLTPPTQQYAIDIRDSAITYINDIEKDPQYKRWSGSIQDLLRPGYPGMLRSIRRNMYHLVLIVDPTRQEARSIVKLAESFYVHNAPVRIGIVLAVDSDPTLTGRDDAGVAMMNAFNYVMQRSNAYDALSCITDLYAVAGGGDVTVQHVEKLLRSKYSADLDEVLGEDSDFDFGRQLAKDFLKRTGFRRLPQVLLNGVRLDENSLNSDDFEEAVLTEIMRQTSALQKALFKGEMKDHDDVLDFLMSQPGVMPRLNDRVLSANNQYLDMTGSAPESSDWRSLSGRELVAGFGRSAAYVSSSSSAHHVAPTTAWIVTDVASASGRKLVLNALDHVDASRLVRVTVLHNPAAEDRTEHHLAYIGAVDASLSAGDSKMLRKLLKDASAQDLLSGVKSVADFLPIGADIPDQERLQLHLELVSRVLNFKPGQRGLVANGRVVGPLEADEDFTQNDMALLERHTMSAGGEKIVQLIEDLPRLHNSDLLMKVMSVLVSNPTTTKTRHTIDEGNSPISLLQFPPKFDDRPFFEITAVVDPLSAGAQKLAPLLIVLQEVLNCRIRLFLNCVEKHSEMPLKSFYRLVLEADLSFSADERLLAGPMAKFGVLPQGALLTQNFQVPDNWLVESVWSPYDLDNIRLENVETDVHSEYELEHLLLEGHCFDQSSGSPPRGLQLTLGSPNDPLQVDTIVMANLGYLQLKANPGSWILRLREGRSSDIYSMGSHEGTDTPANSSDIQVLISSFKSHVLKLKVNKKAGKQHVDLLADDDDDDSGGGGGGGGLWSSITSTFSSSSSKSVKDEQDDTLNIFSLASGHLYERFIRIMMLSVLKHTKTPVKFWFLKNHLSPTLKDFLPHMARHYGFQYELVQYKWPRWLHQQKEKQRIIWGYKILFLDVLFPLNIKKIIFVDADQVVRADLKELRDLDLGGAPYGYTPFCDSRTEMDGFRFWKAGYWRNHLQGRKYHISALYVVDLKRFRRIAAGDRLRGQYQALSQDPNSLSNLDQDLPNNMIHQVPIKSLPQEWLWCETWCDDSSKRKAKTIDLCNNPLTKEAKLDAAVRIVAEWNDYDTEIKRLQHQITSARHDPSEL